MREEELVDDLVYDGIEPTEEAEEEQQQRRRIVGTTTATHSRFVVVGYALTSKKTKSFLQPKLEGLARNKGILFVPIDHSRSLSDQGPFDIVLHKLSGREWRQILESGSLFLVTNHDSIVEVEASRFQQVTMFLLPWQSS